MCFASINLLPQKLALVFDILDLMIEFGNGQGPSKNLKHMVFSLEML